jgi:hypothetical protein
LFPLLRAGLVALFVSLALTHVVELFGVVRLFRFEAPHIERAIFVEEHLGSIRLGMVSGLFAAASVLVAAPGALTGRGGHARVPGAAPWVLSMSLLMLAAFMVGASLTLTRALVPLADSALRSDEFTVAAPGSSSSAFVTMANVMIGMGRSAVLDEMARAESLAITAHLIAIPLAEAAVAVGLVLFIGRVGSSRALEMLAASALVLLVAGAGFALRATSERLVDRESIVLAVVAARTGAVFLLGAMLFAMDAMRQLTPSSAPGLNAT